MKVLWARSNLLEGETLCCSKCGEEKHEEEFGFRSKKLGKRHSVCKTCFAEYHKTHYLRHPEKQVARTRRNRESRRQWLQALKTQPCLDCGVTYPHYVLDFDHRDGATKKFNIAEAVYTASKANILAEIEKCDLVCANCHRVRTHSRQEPLPS